MKRLLVVCVVFFGIFLSCTDQDDNVDMVNIRIKNDTDFLFTEVRIVEKDTVYENISAGEFSEYYEFSNAAEEMGLSIVSDSSSFSYIPNTDVIDSLPIGFYTYEIGIDEGNQVQFKFRIDY